MLSNCGHDERWRYSGGAAGDNTGTEYQIIPWYAYPWDCILRHPDIKVRKMIERLAIQAANNNHIGYDQGQRLTFYNKLKAAGWYPSRITEDCESDCSASTAAIVIAAGHLLGDPKLQALSPTLTTWGIQAAFRDAGFQAIPGSAANRDSGIAGDIYLNTNNHVAIYVTSKVEPAAETPVKASNGIVGSCSVSLHMFVQGAQHEQIKVIQQRLNVKGYRGKDGKMLDVDGYLGEQTAYAIEQLQRQGGLPDGTYWGTVAAKTWQLILN